MTLSRRMAVKTAGLTLSFLLLGAVSLWGLSGMREGLRAANDEYRELRLVREISIHTAAARGLLQPRGGATQAAIEAIDRAIEDIDSFAAFQSTEPERDSAHQRREIEIASQSRAHLVGVRQVLRPVPDSRPESAQFDHLAHIDAVLAGFGGLADQMDRAIELAQRNSAARLRSSLLLILVVAAGAVLVVVVVSISQYRGVTVPLHQLREGVRHIAGGHFKEQIRLGGAPEFSELAADFNRMASQLDAFRTDLERKVVVRSRELVRSERLASVGFLAAGVAHEINNPLNIITGYAELSLRQADHLPESRAATEVKEAFQIIREEGFRCKSITDKLVALAKASNKSREPVPLARIVPSVVTLVKSLGQFRDSPVRLDLPPGDPLTVWGNENELRQVVLSVLANALQAVAAETGEVIVRAARSADAIELSIQDNGCGMTPEVLEHVFEPFFCERRTDGKRGIGLGLSITHAIVEAHGGKITAESNGPGQGSKFTIRFPEHKSIQTPGERAA